MTHRSPRWLPRIGLLFLSLLAPFAMAQDPASPPLPVAPTPVATGTLVVDILPFTSEKTLPKRVDKQLRSGAIEWGVRDNLLVFTMVNRRFIDFPVNRMTRFGTRESLELPPGEYRITGVGLEMTSSLSVDKVLERGAYFNEDIVTFRIEAGRTTTLTILPQIKIDRTFAVNFWMPSMMASISDGTTTTTPVALNDRYPTSVNWPDYNGPLKFKVQP